MIDGTQSGRFATRTDFEEFVATLDCAGPNPDLVAEYLLSGFARITEPQYDTTVSYITLDGRGGGVSRKPGNLVLNWRKLFDTSPDVAVAAAGFGAAGPFVRGLIGLYIWNKVWRSMEEPISALEASVIEGLWCGRAGRKLIPEAEALEIVNQARADRGMASLGACTTVCVRRGSTSTAIERSSA